MGSRRNVIMLNGNRYDASTGELLSSQASTPSKPKHTASKATIDGFVKPKTKPSHDRASKAKPLHRTASKSKTLMRSVVTRPLHQAKKPADTTKPSITKPSIQPNPHREQRAKQINRSKLISKFGGEIKRITKYSPLPVVKPPAKEPILAQSSGQTTTIPEMTHKAVVPLAPKSTLESGLHNANSHNNAKTKKRSKLHKAAAKLKISPSLLNVSILMLSFIVLGSYFAYHNVPNLAMKVASTRSGIAGDMPDYQPAGFSLKGPLQYQTGQIVITYGSHSDDRSYTVTQKNSEWNSETLLQNHVAVNRRPYQTIQEKGKTIYMYDGDNASWVDKGIWYEVNGNESLNTDQVLRIAKSL